MSKKSLITLAAMAALSTAAFADYADPTGQFATQVQSSRDRTEVQAEALAAVAQGALRPSNANPSAYVQPRVQSTNSRADVVAEFLADRDQATALVGEDSGSTLLANGGTKRADHEYLAGTPTRRAF